MWLFRKGLRFRIEINTSIFPKESLFTVKVKPILHQFRSAAKASGSNRATVNFSAKPAGRPWANHFLIPRRQL